MAFIIAGILVDPQISFEKWSKIKKMAFKMLNSSSHVKISQKKKKTELAKLNGNLVI